MIKIKAKANWIHIYKNELISYNFIKLDKNTKFFVGF